MPKRAWLMAIDASVTGTAIVVLGEDMMLRQEFITKASDWEKTIEGRVERFMSIVTPIQALARKWWPERLLIEDYAFNAKGSSGITLGEFGGILRREIIGYFDSSAEVPPSVIKKFATGKGNAGKPAVISALTLRYGLRFDTDNAADAFALAKLGEIVAGYEQAQTRFQQQAADTVLKLL